VEKNACTCTSDAFIPFASVKYGYMHGLIACSVLHEDLLS